MARKPEGFTLHRDEAHPVLDCSFHPQRPTLQDDPHVNAIAAALKKSRRESRER